jgi:uncharacterized damage-inducible protein DinB
MNRRQAVLMAHYNRWMNERLYELCAGLPDVERRRNRGAFFGSIHGTLNHLLLGDRVWLGRFSGQPFVVRGLDQELYADFDELRRERAATDADIERWVDSLSDEKLDGVLRFTAFTRPGPLRCPLWLAVAHFFNHQTHHRGQVTAMLSQTGVDYGITDVLWMPGLVSAVED